MLIDPRSRAYQVPVSRSRMPARRDTDPHEYFSTIEKEIHNPQLALMCVVYSALLESIARSEEAIQAPENFSCFLTSELMECDFNRHVLKSPDQL